MNVNDGGGHAQNARASVGSDFKFNVIAALSRNHTITHHELKKQRGLSTNNLLY